MKRGFFQVPLPCLFPQTHQSHFNFFQAFVVLAFLMATVGLIGHAAALPIAATNVAVGPIAHQGRVPPPLIQGGPEIHLASAPLILVTSAHASSSPLLRPHPLSKSQAAALPPVREEPIIVQASESAYRGYGDQGDVTPFLPNLLVPSPENVHYQASALTISSIAVQEPGIVRQDTSEVAPPPPEPAPEEPAPENFPAPESAYGGYGVQGNVKHNEVSQQ